MNLLKTIVPIFVTFIISINAFSHAENNYEEASRALEIALEELAPERLVVTSFSEKDLLKVTYEGKEVYLNRSMMLGAFDNVYSTLAKELGEKEALALEQAKQSLFAYLKNKSIDLAKTPYLFFKELLSNLPTELRHLSLVLPKYFYSRGPAALAVITVTQVAWEALESAISWSIGAGGAHAYCMTFNIAMLRFVDNFRDLGQYLMTPGIKGSWALKMKYFLTALRRDWFHGKSAVTNLPKKTTIINNDFIQSLMEEYKLDRRYFQREIIEFPTVGQVKEDFLRMANNKLTTEERVWVGYQITLAVDYLDALLESSIDALTDKYLSGTNSELRQRKSIYRFFWELRKIQGYILRQREKVRLAISIVSMQDKGGDGRKALALYGRYLQSVGQLMKTMNETSPLFDNPEKLTVRMMKEHLAPLKAELKRVNRYENKNLFVFSAASCLKMILF